VSNALKFTAKQDGEKRLTVSIGASVERPRSYPADVVIFDEDESAREKDSTDNAEVWGTGDPLYVLVAVKDSGIGIDQEGQQRLFQRFSQIVPKTSEQYGGSGLGLNISRQLCHLHGGEIAVQSVKGKGSTFGFFFKARKCEAPANASRRMTRDSAEETSLTLNQKSTTKLSVLLVEDNLINVSYTLCKPSCSETDFSQQRIVSRKLGTKGFTVTTANNGREAVNMIQDSQSDSKHFDIVLMDNEMPILDGNSATKEIRTLTKEGKVSSTLYLA